MRSKGKLLLLLLVLILGAEVVLPAVAQRTIAHRLAEQLGTNDVNAQLSSTPNALLLLGQVDHAHVTVHQGRLGEVLVSELALDGEDLRLDLGALACDQRVALKQAGSFTLTGVVTEENLREFLARKVDKLENTTVQMTPDGVAVTANIKVFGRQADARLTGTILDDGGQLMFHMTSLSITNAPFGKASLGSVFGDIPLVRRGKMPLGLKVTDVKMQAGKVVIQAAYDAAHKEDVLAPYYDS